MRWLALVALVGLLGCDAQRLETVARIGCPSPGLGELARPTGAFLDSIGFNVPIDLLAPGDEAVRTFDRLAELRVRSLRVSAWGLPNTHPDVLAELDRRGGRVLAQLSIETDVAAFLRTQGARVAAVQIASPANDTVPAYPVTRIPPSAAEVRAIVDALPEASRPIVVGPIIFQFEDAQQVGSLGPWIDLGGLRSTIGLVEPARSFGDWTDMAFGVSGGKPLLAAKASWPATGDTTTNIAVSERRQARYVTRHLLESFNRGVVQTFYDRLQDQSCPDESWCLSGLIRADGTPKPAYLWWRTLVSALGVPPLPAGAATRRLPFSFTTASAPDDVHHTVLQSGDGALWLVLWLEVRGGDRDDVTRPLRLDVGIPLLSAASIDLRAGSSEPVALPSTGPIDLIVSDAPLLLRLEPACF